MQAHHQPPLAHRSGGLLALLLALAPAAWSGPATGNLASSSVRVLTPQERAIADSLAPVPLVDMNLRTAATVRVSAHDRGAPKQAVQRSNLGVNAAVYAGFPTANAPLLPLPPGARQPPALDFQTMGDSVEAWATMTAAGIPHLRLRGYGEFQADATAAWTSRFTLGGSTSKEVVLRFVVPPTVVGGNTEQDGPAWWRARMRTDVLVNGFPAWSTEALRLRADYQTTGAMGGAVNQPLEVLQTFGAPLAFPTDDEDAPAAPGQPSNDSNAGNVDTPSAPQVVSLSLGRFNPGQAIELMLVVRGTAFTRPSPGASSDHRCRPNAATGGFFCSRASMAVHGQQGEAPRITLLP
ncbi:MAG: hypothetical protein V4795_17760 [Pseudomonadota bacterium]